MFRGTTPKITFEISKNIKLSDIKEIWLTLKDIEQNLTLKLSDGRLVVNDIDNTVEIELTQQETLGFKSKEIKLQLRFLDNNDKAFAGDVIHIALDDIIKDGVIA